MGSKRYRTQRLWHNTLMMVWALPFLILPGVIASVSTGKFNTLVLLLCVSLIGIGLAALRDGRKTAIYAVDEERLMMSTPKAERTLMISEIRDASLIDRMGARAYLTQFAATRPSIPFKVQRDEILQFCTVDIGLSTITFGAARRLIDRLPSAKADLLLIRLRDGGVLLLSPLHAQDMVDTLGRRKLQR